MSNRNLIIIGTLTLGVLLRLFYFSFTPPEVRSHDLDGHLERLERVTIQEKIVLPTLGHCWQCHHPPLYYLISAQVYKLANWSGLNSPTLLHRLLQWLALIFSIGFLILGLLAVKRLITNDSWLAIAALTLSLWPSAILHSVRIGNDSLLYLFYAFSFFFLIRWWQDQKIVDLSLAFLGGILATLTKLNGLVILGLVGLFSLTYLFKLLRQRNYRSIIYLAILYLLTTITLGIVLYQPLLNNTAAPKLVNTPTENLRVSNQLANLATIDLPALIKNGGINPYQDESGRQYFLNTLLETALFGEFGIINPINQRLALTAGIFFILLIIFNLIGFCLYYREGAKDHDFILLVITAAALVLAAAAFRALYPFAPSADFRYILPILLSLAPLQAVWGQKFHTVSPTLSAIFTIILISLLTFGAIFIIILGL